MILLFYHFLRKITNPDKEKQPPDGKPFLLRYWGVFLTPLYRINQSLETGITADV